MAKRTPTKTRTDEPDVREGVTPLGTLTVEASLNASYTETRLKIEGAAPGGHSLYVIAERPDQRREEFGAFTWDGERGDLILPFRARRIRLISDLDGPDRVETVIDVVQDFIEDNTPPPPEADTETRFRSRK